MSHHEPVPPPKAIAGSENSLELDLAALEAAVWAEFADANRPGPVTVMPTWTRVADPDELALLPAWFVGRMIAKRGGSFGLLLTTGDVLRVTSITAAHLSSDGTVLLDLRLDHAGVPEGVDAAWRSKHYLGLPVSGGTQATVNLAHVVVAVEFAAPTEVRLADEKAAAVEENVSATVVEIRQAAEDAAERQSID